jgi:hypothetical protein
MGDRVRLLKNRKFKEHFLVHQSGFSTIPCGVEIALKTGRFSSREIGVCVVLTQRAMRQGVKAITG